jgi:hypothetical protein
LNQEAKNLEVSNTKKTVEGRRGRGRGRAVSASKLVMTREAAEETSHRGELWRENKADGEGRGEERMFTSGLRSLTCSIAFSISPL